MLSVAAALNTGFVSIVFQIVTKIVDHPLLISGPSMKRSQHVANCLTSVSNLDQGLRLYTVQNVLVAFLSSLVNEK